MSDIRRPYSAPSIERIAPFFATSSAKMPGFLPSPEPADEGKPPARLDSARAEEWRETGGAS
ncbi:hypothetical protein [Accumulibacter sp.]|uniref:hypothetical protein n=1 Tax=Accumulibacter sp. TaxID=2053492 RepID=UPI0025E82C37|nr:hypothetical protein [Accumulibacter sp.]MCM8634908.1 hypothetical protein [Accumulibacter sp.]